MDQAIEHSSAARQRVRAGATVNTPIFIVGAGRSGSTVFHRMFCEHPDVAWQSPLCDLFPEHPGLNRALLRTAHWPWLGPFLGHRLQPGERYKFWEHYCHGFAQPCRDLLAADVAPAHKRRIPPALAQLATARRHRVLIKVTGWPRVGFLRELFPQAKFIHVYRDGRAVASSLLAVRFWRGWQGPPQWGFGPLDPTQQAEWERHGKSFVALAGIQWKLLMTAMDDATRDLAAKNFLQVRYEDLIEAPVVTFREVAAFCELGWSPRFEHSIRQHPLRATHDKWRENLTAAQQNVLEDVLADSLRKYGYPSGR